MDQITAFEDPYKAPTSIKEAARKGELVIFVGAGASMLCGSPSWQEFAHGMIDQLAKQVGLDYSASQQLKNISDARRKASVAKEIWLGAETDIDFDRILHPPGSPRDEGVRLYQLLANIGAVFVTTNYDRWLDETPAAPITATPKDNTLPAHDPAVSARKVFHHRNDLNIARLDEPGTVLHLHGSWADPHGMVISLSDYIQHYADGYVDAFLRELFSRKTVLFLGYSMSDMEVLDYIVRANPTPSDVRHYLLFPYLSSEKVQIFYLQRYFRNQCGINLLPFCIDKSGYSELVSVIESWSGQVDVRPPHFVQKQELIDQALAKSTSEPWRKAALELIANDEDLAGYFFARVKGKEWFDAFLAAGFFAANQNPAPKPSEREAHLVLIPLWSCLPYLERVSGECSVGTDDRIATEITNIIKQVSELDAPDNDRTWWFFAKCLTALPPTLVPTQLLELTSRWFESRFDSSLFGYELAIHLLPRLLEDDSADAPEKVNALFNVLCRVKGIEADSDGNRFGEATSVITDHWLSEMMTARARDVAKKCGTACIPNLVQRLTDALKSPEDDRYGYIWRNTIETGATQYELANARDSLINGLRDVLDVCCSAAPGEAIPYIRSLLTSEFATLKRVALNATSAHYPAVREAFWETLDSSWFVIEHQHELYLLLKNNFLQFSVAEQTRVFHLIMNLSGEWSDQSKADYYNGNLRRDWLSSLANQGFENIDKAFDALVQQYGPVEGRPELPYASRDVSVFSEASPISFEEMVAMETAEIYQHLKDFVPSGRWDEDSDAGLARVLKEVVKRVPEKFIDELHRFNDLRWVYQEALFAGMFARVIDGLDLSWQQVARFCVSISECEQIWVKYTAESASDGSFDVHRLLNSMLDMLRVALERREYQFRSDVLEDIGLAVATLSTRSAPSQTFSLDAPMDTALNTVHGRAIWTLLAYALHVDRNEDRTGGDKKRAWQCIQVPWNQLLQNSRERRDHEFHALAARHLLQLLYLNEEWTLANILNIFLLDDDELWKSAAHGFAGVPFYSPPLYLALRSSGVLAQLAAKSMPYRQTRERASQYITFAYLSGLEELADVRSSICQVLADLSDSNVGQIVWFLWTLRGSIVGEQTPRIIAFWAYLSERIAGHEEQHRELLSKLNFLSAFIDALNTSTTTLWMQCAPYADVSHNGSVLVSNFARLVTTHPEGIGQIFNATLQSFVPTYDPVDITKCVEQLYLAGAHEQADSICEVYERKVPGLLRDIYNKYNGGAHGG
ncbi:SIR2 family protein [Burkholderia sp. WP9]|uniref:SIR2 family protein n=1 Tax=Burkholderia sp. WP9 TaxID=1500263 RepID=UPI000B80ECCE|nr:SIR2 family protein [Burkholderia sp. WP9]